MFLTAALGMPRPGVPPVSPWVEAHLPQLPPPPARVLDLACGRGRHSLLFLSLGYEVLAVDNDAGALAILEQRVAKAKNLSGALKTKEWDMEAHGLPPEAKENKFQILLVVNYLHRPLFEEMKAALAENGVLVYETWSRTNEKFAECRDPAVLEERALKDNELLDLCRPWAIVKSFFDGELEEYEGRSCAKQMIVAAKRAVGKTSTKSEYTSCAGALRRVMDAKTAMCPEGLPALGGTFDLSKGNELLQFGVEDLLKLLPESVDPASAKVRRERQLQEMRAAAHAGGLLGSGGEAESACASFSSKSLWSTSLVKRTQQDTGTNLKTEVVTEDAAVFAFLKEKAFQTAQDFVDRGDGWTVVANQLQGSSEALAAARHHLFCATGLSGGINAYLTPPGSIGKPPHIDDHDVLVLQQAGAKKWHLLDPATKQEQSEVVLTSGDVLYLPQGVPHYAEGLYPSKDKSEEGRGGSNPSLHLAVGIHRQPCCMATLMATLVALLRAKTTKPPTSSQPANGLPPAHAVQEIDTMMSSFLAYATLDPRHWLRQLAAGEHHCELVQATTAADLRSRFTPAWESFFEAVNIALQSLINTIKAGPKPVKGDAPGAAQRRSLEQVSAHEYLSDLETLTTMPKQDFETLLADAFCCCKLRVSVRHFSEHGPYRGSKSTPGAQGRSLSATSALLWSWPGPKQRPTLFLNGFIFPELADEEEHLVKSHFALVLGTRDPGIGASKADQRTDPLQEGEATTAPPTLSAFLHAHCPVPPRTTP